MKEEVRELLGRASAMPNGYAKADVTREAVRLADVAQDLDLQFETRLKHVSSTVFAGQPAEAIVAYSWLLNHREAYGDRQEYSLLWAYKWIIDSVIDAADFSKEQVDYFIADARKRFEAYLGPQTRPIDSLEVIYRIQRGDLEGARKLLESLKGTKRGELSDCLACEESRRSYDWFQVGDVAAATEVHDAFLKSRRSCAEEPMRANSRASLFYAVAGRWEDAEAMYKSGMAKSTRTPHLVLHCSLYGMAYKLLAGQEDQALPVFDRALGNYMDTLEKWRSFNFYLVSHRVMERQIEKGKKTLRLKSADRLPMAITNGKLEGEVPLPELSAWLLEEAAAIGQKFDQRNGADYIAKRIEARWPFVLGAPD